MAILNNSNAISTTGGYDINNSLRFRSSASAYLSRTPASAGNRQIMTYSFWVKRGAISGDYNLTNATTDASNSATFYFNSSNNQTFDVFLRVGGTNYSVSTSQLFRDPSAWYHIVIAIDTTQATASNRTKVYVNGLQVTNFVAANYVPQNSNLALNNNVAQYIGFSSYFDGYMADVNFIDGSQKAASDFGETDTTTGVWKPKAYTGTYGTNGFYLKFSDIATTSGSNAGLGKDFSGNANYWTTNNISVTAGSTYDAMIDSPTNASSGTRPVGNYCVMNPLGRRRTVATAVTFSEANLKATFPNASGNATFAMGTLGVTSGKWYWEVPVVTRATEFVIGIGDSSTLDEVTSVRGYQSTTGTINGFTSNNGPGATYTSGDTIGVALDIDAGTCAFYKNNVLQATGTGLGFTTIHPFIQGNTNDVANINCGQRPFTYTPPTGFQALCTTNLPTPTILQGNKYMDATLYTGNGATTQVIVNNTQFKPDLVWVKSRSTANENAVYDTVRGANKGLFTNRTNAEDTSTIIVTALNSNGFSVGTDGIVNTNAATYVGWQWQAGQGSTSSNTQGSITSTVSVNTTAGFSIVTYTGTGANATVGHGLGVAPRFIAVKCRNDGTIGWVNYHASLGNTKFLNFNNTNAAGTGSTVWNNTSPTSTTIALGTDGAVNGSTKTYVAYCWAEIEGFSKFGSYVGNGSADGTFVYLGFRPKYVMVKKTNTGNSWVIEDASRSPFNVVDDYLAADSSQAESTTSQVNIDFLSNGFKLRSAFDIVNAGDYIYMAFAENPFKNANAA